MRGTLRQLTIDDKEQVNLLCETIWEGHDYIPESFPKWVASPHAITFGVFEGHELVAICNLELVPQTSIAWVQGLRVKDGFRHKGYGVKITDAIVQRAREKNIRTLWYATGSTNEYSQKVAEKLGFYQANNVGYFRIQKPFPNHSKPSTSIVPLVADSARLWELLAANPELAPSETIPLAWEFDFKSLEGLERLGKQTEFRVVIDDNGTALALYCWVERKRIDEHTLAYTIFSTDRAVFVDIVSRAIDEAAASDADRAVFFLGPGPSQWASGLGYVDEEFAGRRFLLYEKNLIED
jgi:RimJ/RimL family protein N-acetyltransferase